MLPHRTTIYTIRWNFSSTQPEPSFPLFFRRSTILSSHRESRFSDRIRAIWLKRAGEVRMMAKSWKTKLIHTDSKIPQNYESLASPTYRGSTTVFPSASPCMTPGINGESATPMGCMARRPRWSWPRGSASWNPGLTRILITRGASGDIADQFRAIAEWGSHAGSCERVLPESQTMPRGCSPASEFPRIFTIPAWAETSAR